MTTTIIDTTFSGKNISSAAMLYEYTATAAQTMRFQVRLGAVAGNGDYTVYATLNDGGAQTHDVIAPKTTYAASSGETAFWFASIGLDLLTGDVVRIYALGQAGDTNESGSIRIFADNYATPEDVVTSVAVSSTTAAAVSSGEIAIDAHLTLDVTITSTSMDDLSAATNIKAAVKYSSDDADNAAILIVDSATGLLVLAGAPISSPIVAGDGSVSVSGSVGAWNIRITTKRAATALLTDINGSFPAQVEYLDASGGWSAWDGVAVLGTAIARTL